MARHNEIGKIGEDISAKWILSHGMKVIDRNYRKKWGEIDIIARGTGGELHFIEVKTVSYETKTLLNYSFSHETWRPEEKITQGKIKRMNRAIETWLIENKCKNEWQVDLIVMRLVPREKIARIKLIGNVIIG